MTAKILTLSANKAAIAERNALLEQARVIGDVLSKPISKNTRVDFGIDYLLIHSRLAELEARL